MSEIFQIPAFTRAMVALFASGVAFPLLGVYILSLELIPVRFGVMHLSLLGAAVGLMLGADPMLFAILFAVAAGFIVSGLSARGSASNSGGAMALLMTTSLGIVFILFYKTNIQAIEAFNLFWGNVLALERGEVFLVAVVSALIMIGSLFFLRPISAVLFDRETAFAYGLPATAVYTGILVMVCVGIGLGIRITGALMVDAVTLLPALAAQSLKKNFRSTLALASVLGVLSNLSGFALALAFDLPTSPAIIVVGSLAVLACKLIFYIQKKAEGGRYARSENY